MKRKFMTIHSYVHLKFDRNFTEPCVLWFYLWDWSWGLSIFTEFIENANIINLQLWTFENSQNFDGWKWTNILA